MNRTVLAIFKNDKIKSFHIWTTTQEDLKNVTVTNAYSKSKSSINGKLSSESAATTSFFNAIKAKFIRSKCLHCLKKLSVF